MITKRMHEKSAANIVKKYCAAGFLDFKKACALHQHFITNNNCICVYIRMIVCRDSNRRCKCNSKPLDNIIFHLIHSFFFSYAIILCSSVNIICVFVNGKMLCLECIFAPQRELYTEFLYFMRKMTSGTQIPFSFSQFATFQFWILKL